MPSIETGRDEGGAGPLLKPWSVGGEQPHCASPVLCLGFNSLLFLFITVIIILYSFTIFSY